MKKSVILAAMVLLLVSSHSLNAETANSNQVVKNGDTISVDYTGRLTDGTIFDSSRKRDAEKSKNYDAKRTYGPISFTVWAGQMIPGFDKGVVGMKVGEKKTLTIPPKDAYGEAFQTQVVSKTNFADVITQEIPVENFDDIVTQEVPIADLGNKGKDLKIWQVISAGGVDATVTAISWDKVTLEIKNTINPFYGKNLEVGLKSTFDGNTVTIINLPNKVSETTLSGSILWILSYLIIIGLIVLILRFGLIKKYPNLKKIPYLMGISWLLILLAAGGIYAKLGQGLFSTKEVFEKGGKVTVQIDNKQNPFYGKKLTKWLSATLPNGQKITIKDVSDKDVTIELPNTNALAGKTLIFDIQVVSIKDSSAVSTGSSDKSINLDEIAK